MDASVDKDAEEKNDILFTVFELEGKEYGLNVDSIEEILQNIDCTDIPGSPDTVLGVADIRGSVVPVLDLKMILDEGSTESLGGEILLIQIDEERFALPIDKLKDIVPTDKDQMIDPKKITNLSDKNLRWLINKEDEERTIRVLDIKKIIDDNIRGFGLRKNK